MAQYSIQIPASNRAVWQSFDSFTSGPRWYLQDEIYRWSRERGIDFVVRRPNAGHCGVVSISDRVQALWFALTWV